MNPNPRLYWRLLIGILLVASTAIGCELSMKLPPLAESDGVRSMKDAGSGATVTNDPLGKRPTLGRPSAFTPPEPEVFKLDSGATVWLIHKPQLPIVALHVVFQLGAGVDPPKKSGLAFLTADMLDEGAGKRSAVEVSTAINDLGASMSLGASHDGSFASLSVLKKNFDPAFAVFADVLARPQFSSKEFTRVVDLWKNRLRKRSDDPSSVSSVVTGRALYGSEHGYGHPVQGWLESPDNISLADVRAFYSGVWRPENATFIVSGDITRAELSTAIDKHLGTWKPAGKAMDQKVAAPAVATKRRVILVDRADAPQSVIAVARNGVRADASKAPSLDLINTALGGSFTSRLNQNLREEKGWTYGVRSGFSETREQGLFLVRTSVETDKTGAALEEILKELRSMADEGISAEELAKVQAQDRGDLVEGYGTVSGIAGRLASLSQLGLAPSFDVKASRQRQSAGLEELGELAKRYIDPTNATIVIVGPRDQVAPQLEKLGLPKPELWNSEGEPDKS